MITYYIDSVLGSDTNDGLTITTAFKTLQHYIDSITLTNDTTIYLMSGTYTCNSAIITKIPANVSLIIIGKGIYTTLKPTTNLGSSSTAGIIGAVLSFRKLILDMTNMGGTNVQYMKTNFYLDNVALINIPSSTYALFLPATSTTIFTFRNCIGLGNYDALLSAQYNKSNFKLYNCYGRFVAGYNTTIANLDGGNNVFTNTPIVDNKYKITDSLVTSSTIGLYSGTNSWISPVLLKQNNQYYSILSTNYNVSSLMYNPLVSIDFLQAFNIEDLFKTITLGIETFRPIDKFNNFQIVDNDMYQFYMLDAIKSSRELIVANDDIYLQMVSNIDYFNLAFNKSNNGVIKIIFSIDKGLSWKSYNGSNFINLSSVIPLKEYNTLTTDEITQWNLARDEIYNYGITPEVFNTINFNLLNAETIRFAYVLERINYTDVAQSNQLVMQFDAQGTMRLMKSTEFDIDMYNNHIKIIPTIPSDIINVNVMS
jgi:hypothetical protein